MTTPRPTAAIYCRISSDPEGQRIGVERQLADCTELAKRAGYAVIRTFTDNDTGASTLSRKPRPEYERMLDLAEQGKITAIIAYSNSRLTRRPSEREDLIALSRGYGVKIVTVASGSHDLQTADGRQNFRLTGVVDTAEAERIGERVTRALHDRATKGLPAHGGRPFGWQEDKRTPHRLEAELIKKAAHDVLDGVPLRRIAADWNEHGVTTSRGNGWTHTTVRRLLQRGTLAGWRMHHGEIAKDSTGQPVRGVWTPILDQDTFDRLQVALQRDSKAGTRSGRRKYLLTGIARCGVCGKRMNGTKTATSYAYTCYGEPADHTVTITGPATEQLVLQVATARLAEVELPKPEAFTGDDRLEQIGQMIKELMDAYRAGQLSADLAFGQVGELEAERTELKRQRQEWVNATSQQPDTEVTAESLAGLDVDRQRAALETLFSGVIIAPAGRRGEPWTPGRVGYAWRS